MILTERQTSVAEAMRDLSFEKLETQLDPDCKPINLISHLKSNQQQIGIIFEWKRSSPSGGILEATTNIQDQITSYLRGGSVGISVLTEPKWFGGSLTDLHTARKVINESGSTAFLLRKDFIFNQYQILESVVAGADSVLLIVRLLSLIWDKPKEVCEELRRLIDDCRKYGMEPLVEVFTSTELNLAVAAGATVIGFNNRDLETLSVEPLSCLPLLNQAPDRIIPIVLSGITTTLAMTPMLEHGVGHFLIGTHLMISENPARQLACLRRRHPLLKICGVTQIEEVELLRKTVGVAMIGLVFAEGRHQVTTEFAEGVREHVGGTAHQWSSHLTEPLVAEIAGVVARQQRPLLVGVFDYQTTREINEIASRVGLDLIQLHGPDNPEVRSTDFVVPVIRSVGVSAENTENLGELLVEVAQLRQRYPLLLFDTKVPGKLGGTGLPFPIYRLYSFRRTVEFGIAGGITPDNMEYLCRKVSPWLIDISSGVEQTGKVFPMKDPELVRKAVQETTRYSNCVVRRNL